MEISATALCDEKTLKDLVMFCIYRGKYYKTKRILFLIIFPILVFLLAFDLIISFLWQISDFRWLLITIFIAVLVYGVFIIFVLPPLLYKNAKFLGAENTYVFYDNHFTADSESTHCPGKIEIKYSSLYLVYETVDYIYLYINRSQVLLVDKSKTTGGTIEELRSTISSQLSPRKYVICKQ